MSITTGDIEALTAARRGDGAAFETLIAPHRRALHVHCYRMLGSYTDAEDALQESLFLAWRGLSGYEGRAPLRHWLYRITTTTCLKMISRRAREPVTTDDVAWLEPYPDALLVGADADPAAVIDQRASVTLAFVAAMQVLPATQRAVLILRDVLCWSSREVADLLDTTVAAVNSALQRARAILAASSARDAAMAPLGDQERRVVDAFVRAWANCDIPALAALLREDAILTMPPQSIRIIGRADVVGFFATVPADGRLDLIRLVVTRANGHPALAAYLPGDDRECRGYGIMVMTVVDDAIASITGFPSPDLFPIFDCPTPSRTSTWPRPIHPAGEQTACHSRHRACLSLRCGRRNRRHHRGGDPMQATVQVFRARVDPADVARLLEIRPRAIAQAQAACAALVRAELIRLDEETWLDVLTWSRPDGVDELMAKAQNLPLLGEMHSLVGEVLAVDMGELAHSTQP